MSRLQITVKQAISKEGLKSQSYYEVRTLFFIRKDSLLIFWSCIYQPIHFAQRGFCECAESYALEASKAQFSIVEIYYYSLVAQCYYFRKKQQERTHRLFTLHSCLHRLSRTVIRLCRKDSPLQRLQMHRLRLERLQAGRFDYQILHCSLVKVYSYYFQANLFYLCQGMPKLQILFHYKTSFWYQTELYFRFQHCSQNSLLKMVQKLLRFSSWSIEGNKHYQG